jgi:hypothetical protein
VPQCQPAGLFGWLAKNVFGQDCLGVIRSATVGADLRKKNPQVLKHHGSGRMGAIAAEAETQLFDKSLSCLVH